MMQVVDTSSTSPGPVSLVILGGEKQPLNIHNLVSIILALVDDFDAVAP